MTCVYHAPDEYKRQAQLRGQIAEHYPDAGAKINKGDLWIGFPNGSEILFAGLDDVEKLKSIYDITGIWIEEASELEMCIRDSS